MAFNQFPQKLGIPSGNTAGRPGSPVIGDTYYNGELELLEIYNGTQWVASSAPPAVPTITSVTDVGTGLAYTTGGTFTVVVAAGDGGSTPLQYTASTTTGGFSATSSSATLSLTGLTSNTNFDVVANAANNFGTTVNSTPFTSVLATTKPQAPTIGTATASTSANEITVSWTLGNTGGKVLSGITITPYLNGTTAETSRTAATTSSTSYTFTSGQLTANSAYTFKVKTTNANGDSPESSASNSETMPNLTQINYLVIAGGGGGGGDFGGAGGAGGYRTSAGTSGGNLSALDPILVLLNTNYTVTVGGGGSGTGSTSQRGASGGDSVFSTITSTGGGGGGSRNIGSGSGGTGGSGGGAGYNGGNTGAGGARTGSPIQGHDGGTSTPYYGGGGGAGGPGDNAPTAGIGLASTITGSSVTRGKGGDGNAPTANTGGGGTFSGSSGTGGTGAAGVVILRYPSTRTITVGAGLTADATGTDGSFSYKVITAGSGNVSWA
jgi:hypothetical protein